MPVAALPFERVPQADARGRRRRRLHAGRRAGRVAAPGEDHRGQPLVAVATAVGDGVGDHDPGAAGGEEDADPALAGGRAQAHDLVHLAREVGDRAGDVERRRAVREPLEMLVDPERDAVVGADRLVHAVAEQAGIERADRGGRRVAVRSVDEDHHRAHADEPYRCASRIQTVARFRDNAMLQTRDGRLFLAAQSLDSVAIGVAQVALPWLVLDATGSEAQAGLVFMLGLAPYVVFGLPAGLIADRFRRQTVIWMAHAFQACVAVIVPLWAIFATPPILGRRRRRRSWSAARGRSPTRARSAPSRA